MDAILNKIIHSPAYSFLYEDEFLGNNIILLSYIQTEHSKYALRGITLGNDQDILGLDSNKLTIYNDKETDTIIYSVSRFFDGLLMNDLDCIRLLASNDFIYITDLGKNILNIKNNSGYYDRYKMFSFNILDYITKLYNRYSIKTDAEQEEIKEYFFTLIEKLLNIVCNYIDAYSLSDAENTTAKEFLLKRNTIDIPILIEELKEKLDYLVTNHSKFSEYLNKITIDINTEKIFNKYHSNFIEDVFLKEVKYE